MWLCIWDVWLLLIGALIGIIYYKYMFQFAIRLCDKARLMTRTDSKRRCRCVRGSLFVRVPYCTSIIYLHLHHWFIAATLTCLLFVFGQLHPTVAGVLFISICDGLMYPDRFVFVVLGEVYGDRLHRNTKDPNIISF